MSSKILATALLLLLPPVVAVVIVKVDADRGVHKLFRSFSSWRIVWTSFALCKSALRIKYLQTWKDPCTDELVSLCASLMKSVARKYNWQERQLTYWCVQSLHFFYCAAFRRIQSIKLSSGSSLRSSFLLAALCGAFFKNCETARLSWAFKFDSFPL